MNMHSLIYVFRIPVFLLLIALFNNSYADYHAQGKHPYANQQKTAATFSTSLQKDYSDDYSVAEYRWLTPSMAALPEARPTVNELSARRFQPWLNQIKTPYANQLGRSDGRDVTIGVADTVIEKSHPQLIGKIKDSYNGFDGSKNVEASPFSTHHLDHATPVSGAALGRIAMVMGNQRYQYLQGSAVGANLNMAKVFNDLPGRPAWSWSAFNASMRWFIEKKPSIVNLSLGGPSPFPHEALSIFQQAIRSGILFTIAAGNEGQSQPAWPAAYASAYWAQNQIIVVGSVNSNNQLSGFSNAAGLTAPWYVVAPGENINIPAIGKTYAALNGTSFVAPIVAGQAALIKNRWPQLKANEIAEIIFQTCTRLGNSPEGEPDPLYGWGLINIQKSLQPIGVLEVTLANGKKLAVADLSPGNLNGAIGAAIKTAIKTDKFIIGGATDIYNRQFSVNLRDAIDPIPLTLSAGEFISNAQREFRTEEKTLDNYGSMMRYTLNESQKSMFKAGLLGYQENSSLNSFGWIQRFSTGHEVSASVGGENIYMGLADYRLSGTASFTSSVFNNAYIGLMPLASHVGVGKKFNNGTKIKFGLSSSIFGQNILAQSSPNYLVQNTAPKLSNQMSMQHVEISRAFDSTIVGFGFSNGHEKEALLGTEMGKGFSLNAPANTRVFTLNMAHKFSDNVSLAGYFSTGITKGFAASDSLITKVSSIRSQAYGVGFALQNSFKKDDRITFGVSSPLTIISGVMNFDLPQTVDENGNLVRSSLPINLANSAKEVKLEVSYFTPVAKKSSIGITINHRRNANSAAGVVEQLAVVNYQIGY
jgi:subtilisin family serine protease